MTPEQFLELLSDPRIQAVAGLASYVVIAAVHHIRTTLKTEKNEVVTSQASEDAVNQQSLIYILDKIDANEEAIEDLREYVDNRLEQVRAQLTVVHGGRATKEKSGPADYAARVKRVGELLQEKPEGEVIDVVLRWGFTPGTAKRYIKEAKKEKAA